MLLSNDCLSVQDMNGEPADVANSRREEHHRGAADGSTAPHYLADDLNVYVPSGVHPTPPGTWPGPDGDVAAAGLRRRARELKTKPASYFSDSWLGVNKDY